MPTPQGAPRTLAGDLARLRAHAATRPGATLAAVAASLCTLLTFGAAATADLAEDTRPVVAPGPTVFSPVAATHQGPRHRARDQQHPAERPEAPPVLRVSRLDIEAPIVTVSLQDDGVLDPPADTDDVGWWDGSAGAGASRGQTVLTGHTVHGGGGVMDDLPDLEPGDVVRITAQAREAAYRVTRVVTWSKAELADRAVDVFGQDRHHGRLVMVTCTDWDGKAFDSNVIAFAQPIGPPELAAARRDARAL